jgi:hypothetical protein
MGTSRVTKIQNTVCTQQVFPIGIARNARPRNTVYVQTAVNALDACEAMRTEALYPEIMSCFFRYNCNAVAQFKWYTQDVEEDIVDLYREGR